MANKLELNPELLDIQYKMLEDELESLDDLYKEAKNDLDNNRRFATRGSNTFIANQTANLISIKEKRLNIIKELTNIKKTQIDIKAKEFSTNNKLEDNQTGFSKDVLDIYKLISGNMKLDSIETSEDKYKPELEYTDDEVEDILNERLNEGTVEENKKKKKKQRLPDGYSIVVTENEEKYIVDEDYNIIEDCDFDLSLINIVRFEDIENEETGETETYAYDEDGNAYDVVEFGDDE